MTRRQVYHVLPDAQNHCWKITGEGAARARARTDTKAEAVQQARELARGAELGQVIIHRRDGRIQTEHTYGMDPRRTKG